MASTRTLVVEADGGSRGNPGPAGYGAVVRDDETGDVLDEVAAAIGTATNNVAEYSGLLAGLRAAAAIDADAQVRVRMDSKLVVEQMSGRWKIKHEDMRRLALEARRVLPPVRVTYQWIPRERNSHADRLANAAMDAAARGEQWERHGASGGGTTDGPESGRAVREPDGGTYPAPMQQEPGGSAYAGDLSPRETWRLLETQPDAVLVDVRTDAELTFVGVPDVSTLGKNLVTVQWNTFPAGARNPAFLDDLRAAGVAEGVPVAFICRSGQRSAAAAQAATAAGLGPAYNVGDGFEGPLDGKGHRGVRGWRAEGLPWRQS